MSTQMQLGDIAIDVVLKDIKNIHLSVYPPNGRVHVAAPERMSLETIRAFVVMKLGWIKKQQRKLQEQERETPRDFLERESHYLWGQRYLLTIAEADRPPSIELDHNRLVLTVRPGASTSQREAVVEAWYRVQLRQAAMPLIATWEQRMGVTVERLFVQRMKTKWGSCSPASRSIRLNTELAKKPPQCLEYIIVHEMVHLLEPTHNKRFASLMDDFMPHWQFHRDQLNALPVRHEEWAY
jgi:hypothetical protein